jgi:chromosome partitioning protein
MHIVAFCSFKGGTAKTSNVLNISACLAKHHKKKVLLVDFDAQANLSIGLGIGPDSLRTMVPVLQGEKNIKEVIQETNIPGLYLVPANAYLDGIERSQQLAIDPYAHERLRRALSAIIHDFDYCFIDTPPSLGWLTQSAFFASSYSMICAIPEAYSIIALRRLKEFHHCIQQHHSIQPIGVVLSFWDERGAVNDEFMNEINRYFEGKIFPSKVRRDVAVSRAVLQGIPVIEFDPLTRASKDFIALTKEFIERCI